AIGALAGGIGQQVESATARPQIGIAMQAADVDAMLGARERLAAKLGPTVPEMVELRRLRPGETFDARAILERREGNLAAVLTGTPASPELTATARQLQWWTGAVSLIAAGATQDTPTAYPAVRTSAVAASGASENRGRLRTAQAGQLML